MDIFHRFVLGLLFVALGSLAGLVQAAERLGDAGGVYSYSCYVSGSNPVRDYCDEVRSAGETYQSYNQRSCEAAEAVSPDSRACFGPYDPDQSGTLLRWSVYVCSSGYIVAEGGGSYGCYDEPEPQPECSLSPGTTAWFDSALGQLCAQNCEWTVAQNGTIGICLDSMGGDCSYATKYKSQDRYCENPSGQPEPVPKSTFEEYTDEDGCYYDTNGQKFCSIPSDSPCPNYVTIEGIKYCRGAEPDDGEPDPLPDHDSDGDGIPNRDDPNPEDPDADGDGTPDGEQDGDGNGIPDGQPGGIDDGGDGDTPGVEDGSHDGGTCEQDERKEPDCSDDMDPTRCALAMELFHVRCDDKLRHEDIVGTEEYREGDSLTSESEDNNIKTSEYDFSTMLADLDDSGAGFGGGAASCPPDKDINLDGIGTITIPMTFLCDWAEKLRPLIIALGWLSAAFIILSSMRDR